MLSLKHVTFFICLSGLASFETISVKGPQVSD